MRRVSHAIMAMGLSSMLCLFAGHFTAVVFISAIFSVVMSTLDSRFLNSVSSWALSIPLVLIFPGNILVQSFLVGYSAHMLATFIEGRAHLTPSISLKSRVNLSEMRMDMGFMVMFLGALILV